MGETDTRSARASTDASRRRTLAPSDHATNSAVVTSNNQLSNTANSPHITGNTHDDLTSLIDQLDDVISHIAAFEVDLVGVSRCETAYARVERAMRRLSAAQTTIFSSVQRRRVETVEHLRPDDPKAGRHARRKLAQDLQQRTRQSPQELHHLDRTAQELQQLSELAGRRFASGDLKQRHIQLLGETLRSVRPERRNEIEHELVEAGCTMDVRQFSQYCRRRLAEIDHARAADAQRARHERRSLKATMGDDGMLHLTGRFSGIDAETVATALNAFRRPDPTRALGEQLRTSEQVSADAFTQLCDTALRHKDSTAHGHRPQVIITIDHATMLANGGAADGIHAGAMPYDEVRRLLTDAGVARILTDPNGVPVEAGEMTRTVPAGLWRMLVVRDRGCFAATCDAPPGWCDVAHLGQPYRLGGRLAPDNAALACRFHHRMFDHQGWQVTWQSGRPTLRAPIASRSAAGSDIGEPALGDARSASSSQRTEDASLDRHPPPDAHATAAQEEIPPSVPAPRATYGATERTFEHPSLLAESQSPYHPRRGPPTLDARPTTHDPPPPIARASRIARVPRLARRSHSSAWWRRSIRPVRGGPR